MIRLTISHAQMLLPDGYRLTVRFDPAEAVGAQWVAEVQGVVTPDNIVWQVSEAKHGVAEDAVFHAMATAFERLAGLAVHHLYECNVEKEAEPPSAGMDASSFEDWINRRIVVWDEELVASTGGNVRVYRDGKWVDAGCR